MHILVVDDEPFVMEEMKDLLEQVAPQAEIECFSSPQKALERAKESEFQVAFLDIEMGVENGIHLGKTLKVMYPQINIIFVTGYSQYATDALQMRASGYVLKPPTLENIKEEMDNLRNPAIDLRKDKLFVQCFGNFEVFSDGEPIRFERKRTKELLAYLIDRKGAMVTVGEIAGALFENDENEASNKSYCRNLLADLKKTLQKYGYEGVLVHSFQNTYGIKTDKLACDYYQFLKGDPGAIRTFTGEYMSQFSWAEVTLASLA